MSKEMEIGGRSVVYQSTYEAVVQHNRALHQRMSKLEEMLAVQQTAPEVNDKEWLEYKFFCALHDLKDIAPDHYLVTTVEAALQSRPAHLKRQAD